LILAAAIAFWRQSAPDVLDWAFPGSILLALVMSSIYLFIEQRDDMDDMFIESAVEERS